MPDGPPLHPLVAAWLESAEPLRALLDRVAMPATPECAALRALRDAMAGARTPESALAEAERVPLDAADPEVAILFLLTWAEVAVATRRLADVRSLANRVQALVTPATRPELRAAALGVPDLLPEFRGDAGRREQLRREALAALPARSPRRPLAVLHLAAHLAEAGRAGELEAELAAVAERGERGLDAQLAAVWFVQFAQTGRLAEAARLRPRVAGHAEGFAGDPALAASDALLELLAAAPGAQPRADAPAWIWAVHHQVARRPGEALQAARADAATGDGTDRLLHGARFEALNLVRAELAAGNPDAARRLLELRHARGARTPWDDLLTARLAVARGDGAGARRHFHAVMDAADRLRARGRLDFELELATELTPGQVAHLARTGGDVPAPATAAPPAPPAKPHLARERVGVERLVGESAALREIRDVVARYAGLAQSVLITGETGTGKELVARALHEAGSRRDAPFVAVNCGAIAETLLESELFGHERGAFTGATRAHKGLFETAGTGTLFLDEIGEVPAKLQVALLRVLESGDLRPVGGTASRTAKCRVVAATNADLGTLVERERFRQDLLFRLRRLEVRVPPLRTRPEDIVPLTQHFLAEGRAADVRVTMTPELQEAFRQHPWPGNVRELRNVVERMRVLNSDGRHYDLATFVRARQAGGYVPPVPGTVPLPAPAAAPVTAPARPAPLPVADDDAVAALLKAGRTSRRRLARLRELFETHGELTRTEAARILGISLPTATRDLATLIADGTIRKVMPTASPRSHFFQRIGGAGASAAPPIR